MTRAGIPPWTPSTGSGGNVATLSSQWEGSLQSTITEPGARCGFFIYGLCHVEECSFAFRFVECFILMVCWVLSNAFSASVKTITFCFFLYEWSGESGAGFFFVQGFLFTDSFSLFFVSLLRFSVYFGSVWVVCVFLEICPFHLNYVLSGCWLYFLRFLNFGRNASSFISDFSDLGLFYRFHGQSS